VAHDWRTITTALVLSGDNVERARASNLRHSGGAENG
jgi:hypothetical protein